MYRKLAMLYGFGPEQVARMTPEQQLMYLEGIEELQAPPEGATATPSGRLRVNSLQEAERLLEQLRSMK